MTASSAPHGTARRYNHGTPTTEPCRCTPCREANNAVRRRRYRNIAYDRGSTIDAGPVREHVEKLYRESGLGVKRIALTAGVSTSPVEGLLGLGNRPMACRIRRETAAKLLAVAPTREVYAVMDACGSRRRIQALVASGRSLVAITEEMGLSRTTVAGLAHGRWPTVRAGTAQTVREVTSRLWERPPPRDTTQERRQFSTAQRLAARNGWVPFAAWDDIDDPAEVLAVALAADEDGDRHVIDAVIAERADWARLSGADRHLLVRWCRRHGWTRAQIAARLKVDSEVISFYFSQAKDAA